MRSSSITVGNDEGTALERLAIGTSLAKDAPAALRHRGDVRLDRVARVSVDHRADVDRKGLGAADPALGHRTAQHLDDAIGAVLLHAEDAQRRAALAGAVERRGDRVAHDLLGERRRIDEHGVLATGLGDERDRPAGAAEPLGEAPLQQPRDVGRAGEHHALDARIGNERSTDGLASPRHELQRVRRSAGVEKASHHLGGDQRRLLGRLGEHRVAGGERSGDLAGEDRERKVPRADAHDRAERRDGGIGKIAACLRRIEAEEVDCLAHFGNAVRYRLARFAREQPEQKRQLGFEAVGGALEDRGAIADRRGRPCGRAGGGAREGALDLVGGCLAHVADDVAVVGGVAHRRRACTVDGARGTAGDERRRSPATRAARAHGLGERFELVLVGEIDAARIAPRRAVDLVRQRNRRMRPADHARRSFGIGEPLDRQHRILDERVERHRRVGDAMDERSVGAVFEQATDEIREQRLVRADRRVDPAWARQPAFAGGTDDLLVQGLAHAVQALEFVLARRIPGGISELVDRRQCVRVVGRELRENGIGRGEQAARACQVGDVGVGLPCVHRIAVESFHLRALDLAVPVRPFDEADHQSMPRATREIDECIDHRGTALLVRLDDETDAVPAGQRGLGAEPLEQVERELEPVGLLGVDVESDVVAARAQRKSAQHRIELAVDAIDLGALVARMQRRQLDRDSRTVEDAAACRSAADCVDRLLVRAQVARRIGGSEGGLAEHVVRVAKALCLARPRVGERLVDRLAGDELLAHQPHRAVDALSDQRLAALADDACERAREPGFAVRRDELAGEEQRPCRGVDEERGTAAEVLVPLAGADLVADQRIARCRIGDPQQGFGEAHQRDAFR